MAMKGKWHKGSDAWGRGSYYIPAGSVAGASDTGTWSDSPCPSGEVNKEITDLRKFLARRGVKTKLGGSQSGNLFMGKRWVRVANPKDMAKAKIMAKNYLKKMERKTHYIHDAEE